MDGPALRFARVVKEFPSGGGIVRALDGLDLAVAPGAFTAVVGRSGSGKSTLLNLAAGIDAPTTGEVWVRGQPLSHLDDDALTLLRRRHIGVVYQLFHLLPTLDVRENVALPLLLTKLSKAERLRRAETALRIVGLQERLDHYPRTLSGGEQQRVAIARAIVTDPDLIVADEPTGDLDARNAEAILALLRQLKNDFGKTVVMVTHSREAAAAADRVVTLSDGRAVSDVPAADARAAGGGDGA